MPNVISAKDLTRHEVENILSLASIMEESCKENKIKKMLQDKIVACVFYEPSTRTRLSFETAALKLGAKVISAENAMENSSAHKGETIEDTVKVLSGYADIIVIRHPEGGIMERAGKAARRPLINAGDGSNQHPSQGLLDLYTIKKEKKTLKNLKIGFGGDLLNSRTIRSLMPLLRLYEGNKFYFISPKELEMPREFISELQENGVEFEELRSLEEKLGELDVLYMTRVQKERFKEIGEYEKVKDLFILKTEHLKILKPDAIIMHPLPKINEIEKEVDRDPRAAYFRQAENGLYVRMALLQYVLGQ